jgi:hypothetical protein
MYAACKASSRTAWSHPVVVILAAIVIVLLVDQPLVAAATAAVAFVGTVVLGQRADTAMRYRLRHGTRTR